MIALSDASRDQTTLDEIHRLLSTTTKSEREIARETGANKCTVSRLRRRERIARPALYRPKKQTVNFFEEVDEHEIARRAAEIRATWPRWRIEEQEGVVHVDYARESWDLRATSLGTR